MELILVTGNENKLTEFRAILDGFDLKNVKIDLEEIQSLCLKEICEHKVKKAFEIVGKPVLVEDTGFFIDELGGLPGPFIKFFEKKMGNESIMKLISGSDNRGAVAKTCVTYFDGKSLLSCVGEVEGEITRSSKSGESFGFDCCFRPKGFDKTFSEMGIVEKNKISQRRKAIEKFKEDFEKLDF